MKGIQKTAELELKQMKAEEHFNRISHYFDDQLQGNQTIISYLYLYLDFCGEYPELFAEFGRDIFYILFTNRRLGTIENIYSCNSPITDQTYKIMFFNVFLDKYTECLLEIVCDIEGNDETRNIMNHNRKMITESHSKNEIEFSHNFKEKINKDGVPIELVYKLDLNIRIFMGVYISLGLAQSKMDELDNTISTAENSFIDNN